MKLTIVEYPDKRLKEKSKPVVKFDSELHKLLRCDVWVYAKL